MIQAIFDSIRECTDYVSTFPFYYNGFKDFILKRSELVIRDSDGSFYVKSISEKEYIRCHNLLQDYYNKKLKNEVV